MTARCLSLVLCLLVGCTTVNRASLVTSTATILCDWGQTNRAAGNKWNNTWEANPVLGPRPSQGFVAMYFASVLSMNAIAWVVMPERTKSALPVGITVMQTDTIIGNVQGGHTGVCGF